MESRLIWTQVLVTSTAYSDYDSEYDQYLPSTRNLVEVIQTFSKQTKSLVSTYMLAHAMYFLEQGCCSYHFVSRTTIQQVVVTIN